MTKKTSIAPTDIDLYLNKANDKNINEVINLIQRFRKNWRSRSMLESSHHAFIRIFLTCDDQIDKLIEILSKRIEYGVFPDKFCYNLLLDKLIDGKQYENAAKLAVLRMLQEEFDSLTGNYLALKAAHLYLKSDEQVKEELFSEVKQDADGDGEAVDEDEDEIEYIRVPYLRNPFFDDHFDLKETNSLIGKTFYLTGNAIQSQNKELSDNCILYGLALYKKWDKLDEFLKLNSKSIRLSKDLVELIGKFISKLDDSKANEMLDKLKKFNQSAKTLEQLIEDAVQTITKLENDEIGELKGTYRQFAQRREVKMKEDLDSLLRLEIIDQIKEKKRDLKEREKRLYFFENFEYIQFLEHEASKKIKEAEESMKIEEEYIPPKVK